MVVMLLHLNVSILVSVNHITGAQQMLFIISVEKNIFLFALKTF